MILTRQGFSSQQAQRRPSAYRNSNGTLSSTGHKLLVLLLLVVSSNALSKEIELLANQAFVVADIGRHTFLFEEISTGETFTIKGGKKYRYRPVATTAGRYYLKTIYPVFINVDELTFDKPENPDLSFTIKQGSVTYFGKWIIDTELKKYGKLDWDIERDYKNEHLKMVRKRNEYLTRFPLVIANEQGDVVDVPWDKI